MHRRMARSSLKLALSLGMLLLAAFTAPAGLAADFVSQALISVGQGFVICDADLAVVSLAVENTARDAGAAYADNLQAIKSISAALQAAALPGLQITVRQPNLWPKTGLSKEVTYAASAGLDIQVSNTALVGQVADIGLRNGATAVQGVRFDASSLEKAKQLAMERAVQDAITKAQVMSAASGLRLVMVRELHDANDIQVINPSALQSGAAGPESRLPVLASPVYRGQVIVAANVTVTFDVTLDKSKDVLTGK